MYTPLVEIKKFLLSRLDDDEKGVVLTDTLGGPQEVTTVSESIG
jgi:prophage antirepressor-like protein